jgi:hypothetical protein
MATVFVVVALPILALVAVLWAVSADPLGFGTTDDQNFDTKQACQYLSRHTLASTPIGPDGKPNHPDALVKSYAEVAARTAARAAPGRTRRQLLASVRSARSATWTDVDDWSNRPEQVALTATCAPFFKRAVAPSS